MRSIIEAVGKPAVFLCNKKIFRKNLRMCPVLYANIRKNNFEGV